MLRATLFSCALLIPQAALAANVYVPVCCQVFSSGLVCALDHPDATQIAANEWQLDVAPGDTAYFQVSDFTQSGTSYLMEATTWYSTSSYASWTKSGSTATSPGEAPSLDIELAIEATEASPRKPKAPISGTIRIRPEGG